jgi:hypothetical protein
LRPPGLVVLQCQNKSLLDGDWGHERGNLILPFARDDELTASVTSRGRARHLWHGWRNPR